VIQTPAANEECDAPTPPQTRRKGWRKAASSQGRRTTSILQTRARSGYPPFEVSRRSVPLRCGLRMKRRAAPAPHVV
jgi:hypothetical protein